MSYVMVPVPEEHVEDVMNFVLRAMARAAQEPWDEDSMVRLFLEVDELSRTLLAFVARATLGGRDITEAEAARTVQLTGRETIAIQRELNDIARSEGREALITTRTVPQLLPNGRTTDRNVLTMEEDVARLVGHAERQELAAAEPPAPGP
jgi:hypothetical protein